jgi:hypothetical protein
LFRSGLKFAFYVAHPQAAYSVRIHALTTDHAPLNIEMFEERGAAAKWLSVPIELLLARTSGTNP